MWVLEGASPTGPTFNGQPDVDDFKAGSTGEKLSAPSERGNSRHAHYHDIGERGTKKNLPW
jgi:hypothetical protein